jgi:[ribosomal protein S18]-alanine N-acetyltransferase
VSLIVRPATRADVPRLVEIARRAFLSAFKITAPFALLEQWQKNDREPAWYERDWPAMRVCERNGEVAGLVQPRDDEVNGLWVHPDHQGHGVGTMLLAEGEDEILRLGYDRSWLTCSSYNPRAVQFYEARGYVTARTISTVHPCGVTEPSFRMERLLVTREG